MATKNKPNELYITRSYEAPVKAVWDAWTDPEQVAKWWGPRDHWIKTHSKDLKVGGHWSYTMYGPNGQSWENKTKYLEVETYSRLVYDHGGNEDVDREPLFRVMVQFSELSKNRAQMEMTMILKTPEAAAETKKFIRAANGNSTWDRLAEFLDEESSGKEIFVINRSFDTSIETMFDMWTKPEHVAQWLPPTGMDMTFLRAEIKPGGSSFYCMQGHGMKMYGHIKYLEITKPSKIVYSQEFCDENEKPARHPMAPTWPATMLTKVELTSEDLKQTRVTITWEVVGEYTQEELATFLAGRPGMTQGWTGSFDKLENILAKNTSSV